jgi:alpha/beta superfamily hydrolase
MTEQTVHFPASSLQLEGLLSLASGDKGVVITHPHPLYGGDMHNNVVDTLARVYRQHGYTTLRFNFRGVGGSQGHYDEGEGEQEDIKAALDYLLGQGKTRLDLAG